MVPGTTGVHVPQVLPSTVHCTRVLVPGTGVHLYWYWYLVQVYTCTGTGTGTGTTYSTTFMCSVYSTGTGNW